jgi:hypothetical protein
MSRGFPALTRILRFADDLWFMALSQRERGWVEIIHKPSQPSPFGRRPIRIKYGKR